MMQVHKYFMSTFGKKYFIFNIDEDTRYNDIIANDIKEEQKHLEDYRT